MSRAKFPKPWKVGIYEDSTPFIAGHAVVKDARNEVLLYVRKGDFRPEALAAMVASHNATHPRAAPGRAKRDQKGRKSKCKRSPRDEGLRVPHPGSRAARRKAGQRMVTPTHQAKRDEEKER